MLKLLNLYKCNGLICVCVCRFDAKSTPICVLPVSRFSFMNSLILSYFIFMFVTYWAVFFLSRLCLLCLPLTISVAASLSHLILYPCFYFSSYFSFLFISFSSVHWGHWKTLAWVPSSQEAQRLRVDWSLDFTTGSQNRDCSRSFSFPLRPLWIKDSWLLLQ